MIKPEIIFKQIDKTALDPDPFELAARLGLGCSCLGDAVEELLPEVERAAEPKYSAVRLGAEYPSRGVTVIDGHIVSSEGLYKCLDGAREVYLLAVTLGASVDRYLYRLGVISGSDRFVSDGIASALCERAADIATEALSADGSLTHRFSPGYGDLSLLHQQWLLDELSARELLGITLTESGMMVPMKSITAIIGIKNG